MLTAVVGVASICFLLMYLSNSLDSNKHFILQILLLVFVFTAMMYIPKAVVDSQTVCEIVVANSTNTSATETTYEYTNFCFTRPESTGQSFLDNTQRLYYLILGYAIVALAVVGLIKLQTSGKMKRGKK